VSLASPIFLVHVHENLKGKEVRETSLRAMFKVFHMKGGRAL
jgi:hypothetical protein